MVRCTQLAALASAVLTYSLPVLAAPTVPTSIEAESMAYKSVGGSYDGIWNLWENGYLSNDVTFPSNGQYTFNILASGTPAQGVYPEMRLRIDGTDVGSFTVNSTTQKQYTATVNVTGGTHSVAIAYVNDVTAGTEDRNLLVDKVSINAASTTPPVPTAPATLEAEQMETRTTGEAFDGYWGLWSNGYIENRVSFPTTASYEVKVAAYGSLSGGVGPILELRVDGAAVATKTISSSTLATYAFPVSLAAGTHRIAVAFTNDANVNGEDRNLVIDKVSIATSSSQPPPPPPPPPPDEEPVGIRFPFGSHPMAYAAGTIKPTNATQAQMDSAVKRAYDSWKSNHLAQMCGSGRWVVKGGQNGYLAVSEGQGYGMLLTVLMAGYDPQARTLFDGIYRFARDHGSSTTSPYLMGWLVNNDCTLSSPWPAADGDLDMALALIMADRQWGSTTGSINYLQEARNTLGAIEAKQVSPLRYVAGGPSPDITRTSDMMFAHFRAFQKVGNASLWTDVINKSYSLLETVVNTSAPSTGLMPDVIVDADTNNPRPSPGNRLESPTEGYYAWNACRNPWRLGTDVVVSGNSRSKALTHKLVNYFQSTSGGNPSNIFAVYYLGGGYEGAYNSMAFQAPIGVGAMVDGSHQSFLNNIWNYMAQNNAGGYYEQSIQVLSMIVISGNWWQP